MFLGGNQRTYVGTEKTCKAAHSYRDRRAVHIIFINTVLHCANTVMCLLKCEHGIMHITCATM